VGKKDLRRGLVIFLLCIVVFSVCGVQWITFEADVTDWEDLQPGDILFVDIYEGWSHGGFWDHAALYVGDQPPYGECVVEATFDGGVVITWAYDFFTRDGPAKIGVRRLKAEYRNEEVIQRVVEYALDEEAGKPFDYTAHLTTVPHKLIESRLHCAEVVWRAYKAAGIDVDCNDGLLIYPDDIYFSSKLEPVK